MVSNKKYDRGEAYKKIKKRVLDGPPCEPKDLWQDPELDLKRRTVTYGLRLGQDIGDFHKVDGFYVPITKIPSETTALWQPQPGEITRLIEGLKSKEDNPEKYKASLQDLKNILNRGYWDDELDIFFIKALGNPDIYEEVIDRLLRAVPRSHERLDLFFKRNMNEIYDLVKSSDRLGSPALIIFINVSKRKEALDKIEKDLKGEGAERVLKAALGYGWKLHKKFNHDFKEFLQKALDHKNEKVRQYASSLISETYYT